MPNWACNHIVASGDLEQLRALAQTLNTMPNYSSGFGRYWMGNLAAAPWEWTPTVSTGTGGCT